MRRTEGVVKAYNLIIAVDGIFLGVCLGAPLCSSVGLYLFEQTPTVPSGVCV